MTNLHITTPRAKQANPCVKYSRRETMRIRIYEATLFLISFNVVVAIPTDECQVTPVIHILQQPGCIPKPIASYACMGRCTSYVQVSNEVFFGSNETVYVIGFWE